MVTEGVHEVGFRCPRRIENCDSEGEKEMMGGDGSTEESWSSGESE